VKNGLGADSGSKPEPAPLTDQDITREEKIRPVVLEAIEDTLREGAEVWLELAKH
jgi:hypothetical protein